MQRDGHIGHTGIVVALPQQLDQRAAGCEWVADRPLRGDEFTAAYVSEGSGPGLDEGQLYGSPTRPAGFGQRAQGAGWPDPTPTGHLTAEIDRREAVDGGCRRGCYASAASRFTNSSGVITRWVVPSRQGVCRYCELGATDWMSGKRRNEALKRAPGLGG